MNNAQKFEASNYEPVLKMKQPALDAITHLGLDKLLERRDLRATFEKVFESFGPFVLTEGVQQTYENPTHTAMYVAFVQTLRESRGRLINLLTAQKKPNTPVDHYIVLKQLKDGNLTPGKKLQVHRNKAQACHEAIRNTEGLQTNHVVYQPVAVYTPRPKQVVPTVNPIEVLNNLHFYRELATSAGIVPPNMPCSVVTNQVGTTLVLHSGETLHFTEARKAYEHIDSFLKDNAKKRTEPHKPKGAHKEVSPTRQNFSCVAAEPEVIKSKNSSISDHHVSTEPATPAEHELVETPTPTN